MRSDALGSDELLEVDPLVVRVALHLVDRRPDRCVAQQLLQVSLAEVLSGHGT